MVFDLNDQKNKVFHLNVCVCVCVCSVLSHCLHKREVRGGSLVEGVKVALFLA